tara:strand:+ start:12947 stop:13120 length:174 start_codon:yes stop_codon:yes gene_type:complete
VDKTDIPETIIYVDTDRVWCMGEQMDHPKVYYTVPDEGYVVCGYCDIKFARKKKEDE